MQGTSFDLEISMLGRRSRILRRCQYVYVGVLAKAMAPQRPGLWSPLRSQVSVGGTRARCDEQRNDV